MPVRLFFFFFTLQKGEHIRLTRVIVERGNLGSAGGRERLFQASFSFKAQVQTGIIQTPEASVFPGINIIRTCLQKWVTSTAVGCSND